MTDEFRVYLKELAEMSKRHGLFLCTSILNGAHIVDIKGNTIVPYVELEYNPIEDTYINDND
jgi:hypothetical protein